MLRPLKFFESKDIGAVHAFVNRLILAVCVDSAVPTVVT